MSERVKSAVRANAAPSASDHDQQQPVRVVLERLEPRGHLKRAPVGQPPGDGAPVLPAGLHALRRSLGEGNGKFAGISVPG